MKILGLSPFMWLVIVVILSVIDIAGAMWQTAEVAVLSRKLQVGS